MPVPFGRLYHEQAGFSIRLNKHACGTMYS